MKFALIAEKDSIGELVKRASEGEKVSARESSAVESITVLPYKSPPHGWQVAADGIIRNYPGHLHDVAEYLLAHEDRESA